VNTIDKFMYAGTSCYFVYKSVNKVVSEGDCY